MGIWQKQVGKLVEHRNQSQPNPGQRADGTPCIHRAADPAAVVHVGGGHGLGRRLAALSRVAVAPPALPADVRAAPVHLDGAPLPLVDVLVRSALREETFTLGAFSHSGKYFLLQHHFREIQNCAKIIL